MAKYTTEVRSICEVAVGLEESEGYQSVNQIVKNAIPKVFNFDFPIFDESYRNILCSKILKHYYTREIGLETVGLWKLKLDTKLNEIMPYYNQLYRSQLLEFNPFYEVDLTRDYTKTADESKFDSTDFNATDTSTVTSNDTEIGVIKDKGSIVNDKEYNDSTLKEGTTTKTKDGNNVNDSSGTASNKIEGEVSNTNNSSSEGAKWKLYSDTPQGSIAKIGLEGNNYLTNATKDTDDTTTTTTDIGTNKSTENKSYADVTKMKIDEQEDMRVQENVGKDSKETQNTTNDNTTNTDITNTKKQNSEVVKNNNTISNGTAENLETYFEKVKGKTSSTSYSRLLMEFRDTFLNIDNMVIDELQDLFMLVW